MRVFFYYFIYIHIYLEAFKFYLFSPACSCFTAAGRQFSEVDVDDGGSVAPPCGKCPNCCLRTRDQDIERDGLSVTQTHQAEPSAAQFGKRGRP